MVHSHAKRMYLSCDPATRFRRYLLGRWCESAGSGLDRGSSWQASMSTKSHPTNADGIFAGGFGNWFYTYQVVKITIFRGLLDRAQ